LERRSVPHGENVQRISRLCVATALAGLLFPTARAAADPIAGWSQPGGTGTPVVISYSYSNLLDGSFLLLSPAQLRAATEEALGVWAAWAPLHFVELPDAGPPPSDVPYRGDGLPRIRIGHHPMPDLAHGYFPGESDGLAGDLHFEAGIPWTLGLNHWNFLEAITHELGHALGLPHEAERMAIMNAFYPNRRFLGLGSAFLFPADIELLQALYGAENGSVQALDPVPEPAAFVLVATGLAALGRARLRHRQRNAAGCQGWTGC
jgi:hypothetical protein